MSPIYNLTVLCLISILSVAVSLTANSAPSTMRTESYRSISVAPTQHCQSTCTLDFSSAQCGDYCETLSVTCGINVTICGYHCDGASNVPYAFPLSKGVNGISINYDDYVVLKFHSYEAFSFLDFASSSDFNLYETNSKQCDLNSRTQIGSISDFDQKSTSIYASKETQMEQR
jgi:hypothetical protein